MMPVYTIRQLKMQIKMKNWELGRTVLYTETDSDPRMASAETFLRNLSTNGVWEEVIEASGFEVSWSTPEFREKSCRALWRWYEESGWREPTAFSVRKCRDPDMPNTYVYNNVFGDFTGFLVASGVREDYLRRGREEVVRQILERSKELGGKTPPDDDPYIDSAKVRRFFGKHNKAVKAAGLKINKEHTCDEAQMLKDLRRQFDETGNTPTHESIDDDPRMASAATYRQHFVKLEYALKKARVPLGVHRRGYGVGVVEGQLRQKTLTLGKVPTQADINNDPEIASVPTFIAKYGSWKEVQAEARKILAEQA